MDQRDGKRRVAIACQGGGSHAAFTAGVLKRLLAKETLDEHGYEIVGLSGTSGGAICAFLAWYALLREENGRVIDLLDSFWKGDNSARSPEERLINDLLVWNNSVAEATFGVPVSSPYYYPFYPYSPDYWQDRLGDALRSKIGEGIEERVRSSGSDLMLFVGAVNVLNGEFRLFRSHKPDDGGVIFNDGEEDRIGVEAILASAALPFTFKAVHTGKSVYRNDPGSPNPITRVSDGVYWDGLSSQNPPIRDLTGARPDEIWVVQINPEEIAEEPKTTAKIWDRRNELAGNLSLNQEIHSVRKTNELVRRLGEWEAGARILRVPGPYENEYKVIKVRRIELSIPLNASSKLDRRPSFIEELMGHGEERAGDFLEMIPFQLRFEAAWEESMRTNDESAVMDFFAADAVVRLAPPSSGVGPVYTGEELRDAVRWCLEQNFNLEQSRDYRVDRESRACWMLATSDYFREPVKGWVETVIRDDKIQSLTFYPLSLEVIEEL